MSDEEGSAASLESRDCGSWACLLWRREDSEGNLVIAYKYLQEDGASLFSVLPSDMTMAIN